VPSIHQRLRMCLLVFTVHQWLLLNVYESGLVCAAHHAAQHAMTLSARVSCGSCNCCCGCWGLGVLRERGLSESAAPEAKHVSRWCMVLCFAVLPSSACVSYCCVLLCYVQSTPSCTGLELHSIVHSSACLHFSVCMFYAVRCSICASVAASVQCAAMLYCFNCTPLQPVQCVCLHLFRSLVV
jgi:hypothetical protein